MPARARQLSPATRPRRASRLSCPRMRLFVNASQSLARHVSVDLGCAHIRVSEELLNRSQIGTSFKEMSRKRVPKRVRVQRSAVGHGKTRQDPARITRSETPFARVHEQRARRLAHEFTPPGTDIVRYGGGCWIADWHPPHLRAFAEHRDEPVPDVEVVDVET